MILSLQDIWNILKKSAISWLRTRWPQSSDDVQIWETSMRVISVLLELTSMCKVSTESMISSLRAQTSNSKKNSSESSGCLSKKNRGFTGSTTQAEPLMSRKLNFNKPHFLTYRQHFFQLFRSLIKLVYYQHDAFVFIYHLKCQREYPDGG